MLPLLAPIAVLLAFFQEFWDLIKEPKYRSLIYWTILIIASGTIFYSLVESSCPAFVPLSYNETELVDHFQLNHLILLHLLDFRV